MINRKLLQEYIIHDYENLNFNLPTWREMLDHRVVVTTQQEKKDTIRVRVWLESLSMPGVTYD